MLNKRYIIGVVVCTHVHRKGISETTGKCDRAVCYITESTLISLEVEKRMWLGRRIALLLKGAH